MTKQIFLHIGFLKTGTTSIQNFLFLNSDNLKNEKVFYPNDNRAFQGIFCTSLMHGFNPRNPPAHLRKKFQSDMQNSWEHYLSIFAEEDYKKMIISCEWFIGFCQNENLINRLKYLKTNILKDFDVKIIIYLRPIASYLKSLYQESVKINDSFSLKFHHYLNNHVSNQTVHIRQDNLLKIYSDIFGKENMLVKEFKGKDFGEKGLIHDFFNTIEEDCDKCSFPKANNLNTSLSKDLLEIKLLRNKINSIKNNPQTKQKQMKNIIDFVSVGEFDYKKLQQKTNNDIVRTSEYIQNNFLESFSVSTFELEDLYSFKNKRAIEYIDIVNAI